MFRSQQLLASLLAGFIVGLAWFGGVEAQIDILNYAFDQFLDDLYSFFWVFFVFL